MSSPGSARGTILAGHAVLGIELGSTRIKACLIGDDAATVLAVGVHEWSNRHEDGHWTYSLDDVWSGIQAAYADLVADAARRHGASPDRYAGIGVSAMMHGYLAFDAEGRLLVPFRTWRDETTGPAANTLTQHFGVTIPLRWSIAHHYQAILDSEAHAPSVRHLTTLAGYVHSRLTGRRVLGVGDASGMFPIDPATNSYDTRLMTRFDELVAELGTHAPISTLLPDVLVAGQEAGSLTPAGAALLDPSGALQPGAVLCPPEGDAGTGMVATCSVAPRTGNVSVGTSIFAMIVLQKPLERMLQGIDMVTTPAGDPVAMVHCNDGAETLAEWAALFGRFADAAGAPMQGDAVFELLLREALDGEPEAGGLLAGEAVGGNADARALIVRTPGSRFTLANVMRAQLYGIFARLALGMSVLEDEVVLDQMFAHGGLFRTSGVAQRFLATALDTPVSVGTTASEGGAWGIAVLASYLAHSEQLGLDAYLHTRVFRASAEGEDAFSTVSPHADDVAGFALYLDLHKHHLEGIR